MSWEKVRARRRKSDALVAELREMTLSQQVAWADAWLRAATLEELQGLTARALRTKNTHGRNY